MRIGLVKYINSRPLDYGFRKNTSIETIEETPARLYELLKAGELDAALISSVECLRNSDIFQYCKKTGVCASSAVNSIFYLTRAPDTAPQSFFSDSGSRTSVALLQILLYKKFGKRIPHNKCPPEDIIDQISDSAAGLIIGDIAYRYSRNDTENGIQKIDLGKWWNEEEGLPFVFALWAYPAERPLPDSLFQNSLEEGLTHMEEILSEHEDPGIRKYLTESLHYRLGEKELSSLERFRILLQELDLL